MAFLIKQTACDGSTFSTVAAGPPLNAPTPFHFPVRAYLCLSLSGSVLQTGSWQVSGRRTAGCPRRTIPAGQALLSLPGTYCFRGEWLVTHCGLQPHYRVPRAPRDGLSAFQPGSRTIPLTACGYARVRARVAGGGVGGGPRPAGSPGPRAVGEELPQREVLFPLKREARAP